MFFFEGFLSFYLSCQPRCFFYIFWKVKQCYKRLWKVKLVEIRLGRFLWGVFLRFGLLHHICCPSPRFSVIFWKVKQCYLRLSMVRLGFGWLVKSMGCFFFKDQVASSYLLSLATFFCNILEGSRVLWKVRLG